MVGKKTINIPSYNTLLIPSIFGVITKTKGTIVIFFLVCNIVYNTSTGVFLATGFVFCFIYICLFAALISPF